MLEALAARWHVGRHVVEPFRVVIAGAPNVGKSSLANAIAGYQRTIVSPTPGTTRDLVSTALAVEGWPIVLTDTAGLRLAGEDLEGRGIEQARAALAGADVVLWVLDASAVARLARVAAAEPAPRPQQDRPAARVGRGGRRGGARQRGDGRGHGRAARGAGRLAGAGGAARPARACR